MIYEESRYEDADLLPVLGSDGAYHVTVFPHLRAVSDSLVGIRARDGDTFASIAGQVYKDPEMWWLIADANPHVFFPDDLHAGQLIYIPSIAAVR